MTERSLASGVVAEKGLDKVREERKLGGWGLGGVCGVWNSGSVECWGMCVSGGAGC